MGLIHLLSITGSKTLAATLLLVFVWPLLVASFALAQVTTTITPTTAVGSLGTTVTTDGHTVQITGGTRPGNGTNLFHSFDQFNVGRPDTAQFLNTTPSLHTSNILGRVAGGNPSSIFGTIDTMSYPQANLFLMNPAGIIFGPNATLNVSGSVAFTTADYLRLTNADGSNAGIFHADTTATSLLTSASVAAFGFLGTNPAAIEVQRSTLIIEPGQSISLVGGNITVQSGMLANKADPPPSSAPGKQVYIASLASPGEILAGTLAPAANINGQSPGILGAVQISQSNIDISDGGGTIRIRGGRLVVDGSTILANTGDISLDATSILITNSAQIGTFTTSAANAGHIILEASRDIEMDSNASVASLSVGALGDAGNITLRSREGNVIFTNKASVTSQTISGGGNTGSIAIDSQNGDIRLENSFIFPSAAPGTGKIGGVRITANNLELLKESRIDSDNFSTQVAGNIDIQLRGLLSLTGSSEIETTTSVKAPAADLLIKAREIRIADGSKLSADTTISSSGAGGVISIRGPQGPSDSVLIDGTGSGIFTGTNGTGPGGAIDLYTRSLTIQNGGTISAETSGTAPSAKGGSIVIDTTDQITMTSGASITASSTDPGNANAGDILINAGQRLEMRDSSIKTESEKASGGNIDIQAVDRVRLVNSPISTSVPNGTGNGGNITIDPNVIVLQNSDITAKAVQGAGGNITLTTPLFLRDSSSQVDASSQFGVNGTVTIQSPTSNVSGSLGLLTSKPSQAQALLTQRCAALANGQASSFVVAGREQLPSNPGGWLTSPFVLAASVESLDTDHVVASTPASLPVAGPETSTVSLRRLTPAGFLMANFAESEATGCRS